MSEFPVFELQHEHSFKYFFSKFDIDHWSRQKQPLEMSLKISQYSQEEAYVGVSF